jgi:Protein of unknown function (DUF1643)
MNTLPLEQNAVISACGRYRYLLTRQVASGGRRTTFIMLNPSTADASNDDPTIRRCIGFAQRWGCGQLADPKRDPNRDAVHFPVGPFSGPASAGWSAMTLRYPEMARTQS